MDMKTEQGNVEAQQPLAWRSQDRFVVGCDLGQAADPTAIAAIQYYAMRETPTTPVDYRYDVRHLMRMPLGLSYPAIVQDVGLLLQRPPLTDNTELVIDETGVGRAVGDIFAQQGLKPIRVNITAGDGEGEMVGGCRYNVSKSYLVSNLDAKLHTGELRFAKNLAESAALEAELKDFKRHVTEAGRFTFSARSGAHDDLVLAVAIALWRAVKQKPRFDSPTREPRVVLGYSKSKQRYRRRNL